MFPFLEAKAIDDAPNGGLLGYLSVFGRTDSYGDTVRPGAFEKTIPDFLRDGFIAWAHDWETPVAMPMVAREDARGLYIEAHYHSDPTSQRARAITNERLEAGKRMGLSIGYEAESYEMEKVDPPIRGAYGQLTDQRRALTQIKLYEGSLVLVPAEREANVTGGKDGRTGQKAAIPSHSTATDDGAWDGSEMRTRLSNDAGRATFRRAFAWVDPDGDPDVKASYRFIHHMVSEDGAVGAANLRACSTGIGVLNGGRGGTTIPAGDREGVHRHLARHLTDAGQEAPPLKSLADFDGETFSAHGDRVLGDVRDFCARASDLHELRLKEGRELSERNRGRLRDLLEALGGLDPLRASLSEWLAATERKPEDAGGEEQPEPKRLLTAAESRRLRVEAERTAARIARELRGRLSA